MTKIKIGIIGAGMIGDVHIDRILRDGRGEVTWIASRTDKTLHEKLEKFGIENGTTDYWELLRDDSLDAVIIASPPFTHLQMVKDCLAAEKHILLEKPMVAARQDLDELVATVLDYPDLKVLECSCRHARLQPKFKFIKTMIAEDAIGEIYHIHHQALSRSTFIEYNPAGFWAHQKNLAGGGPFIDWGVYDLSFHLGLLDDTPHFKGVKSFKRNGLKSYPGEHFVSDIEEHGAAFLEFDNGLTYYYERGSGVQAEVPNETRLYGTKGSLRFSFCSWDPPELDYYHTSANGKEQYERKEMIVPADHDDNLEIVRHFLDVLTKDVEPLMTVELAAKHLDILFRIIDT